MNKLLWLVVRVQGLRLRVLVWYVVVAEVVVVVVLKRVFNAVVANSVACGRAVSGRGGEKRFHVMGEKKLLLLLLLLLLLHMGGEGRVDGVGRVRV